MISNFSVSLNKITFSQKIIRSRFCRHFFNSLFASQRFPIPIPVDVNFSKKREKYIYTFRIFFSHRHPVFVTIFTL